MFHIVKIMLLNKLHSCLGPITSIITSGLWHSDNENLIFFVWYVPPYEINGEHSRAIYSRHNAVYFNFSSAERHPLSASKHTKYVGWLTYAAVASLNRIPFRCNLNYRDKVFFWQMQWLQRQLCSLVIFSESV